MFDAFASVANKVSTKVLLELWVFFKNRRSDENRLFCIKKERVNKFFETVDTGSEERAYNETDGCCVATAD